MSTPTDLNTLYARYCELRNALYRRYPTPAEARELRALEKRLFPLTFDPKEARS